MGEMMTDRVRKRKSKMCNIVREINETPCLSVSSWCAYGQEHFIGDMPGGTYWKPANITVSGDMTDMATIRVLDAIMEKYGLEVHTCRGYKFSEKSQDGSARLVPADGTGWY